MQYEIPQNVSWRHVPPCSVLRLYVGTRLRGRCRYLFTYTCFFFLVSSHVLFAALTLRVSRLAGRGGKRGISFELPHRLAACETEEPCSKNRAPPLPPCRCWLTPSFRAPYFVLQSSLSRGLPFADRFSCPFFFSFSTITCEL